MRQGDGWRALVRLTATRFPSYFLTAAVASDGMENFKPEPVRLSTDRVPTPEVLTEDLRKIVHELADWESLPLLALRSLPSVRFTPAEISSQGPASNQVIPLCISNAISRVPGERKKEALRALFTWNDLARKVGKRLESAAEAQGSQYETFRKGGERDLLGELALEIFRGELAWATHQIEPSPPRPGSWAINAWCQLLEWERSVTVDSSDTCKQTWKTRMRLRAISHDLPLLVTVQRWSGGGDDETSEEPGTITVSANSRRRKPTIRAPRLVDCSRASENEFGWSIYLWDLGQAKILGEEFEHSWEQVLIDNRGVFRPYLGFGTESYPSIAKVRLRAKLPSQVATEAYARHMTKREGYVAGTYAEPALSPASEPLVITEPDADGFFTYEPDEVVYPDAYELWWGSDTPVASY